MLILPDEEYKKSIYYADITYKSAVLEKPSYNSGYSCCWIKDGVYHRDKKPALIYDTGSLYWYKDGLLHREDGPATIAKISRYAFGEVHFDSNQYILKWYFNGEEIKVSSQEEFEKYIKLKIFW